MKIVNRRRLLFLAVVILVALAVLAGAVWEIRSHRTLALLFDGTSLTAGQGATAGNSYPDNVARDLRIYGAYIVANVAIGGQTTEQMTARAPTVVDPHYNPRAPYNVLAAWEISNDLFSGASSTTAYNNFVAYAQARRAVGWKLVILTILPRSDTGTPAGFESSRQWVNSRIRANWATFADSMADVAADGRIGDAGAETDTRYYDGSRVHLNNAGYPLITNAVKDAILSLSRWGAPGLFWENVFAVR